MEAWKTLFLLLIVVALFAGLFALVSCGDDDDDDDDDAGVDDDDDAADDDDDDSSGDDDDDDDTSGPPCEDLYDVIIEGQTDMGRAGAKSWAAKLTLNESGTIIGVIDPDDEEMDQYSVAGFRYDQTTGYLDGSFDTPESMVAACAEDTVYNHIDLMVLEGVMTGVVTFYCGEVDQSTLMGTYDASGNVTCGDFAG